MKLLLNAGCKFILGLILVGILLFAPAGGFGYWNGWLFIVLLFIPMLILGVILWIKAPELLEKRLQSKEKQVDQKSVVAWSALIFVAGFIIAGLDYRFSWTRLPLWMVIAAAVVLLLSYGMYAEVMRENAYLSRTVEIQDNQKVIDTGLYGIVRHPMYLSTVLLFVAMPIVLGSAISLVIFLFYPFLLVKRIKNEEEILEQGLDGYAEYKQKVKYRMIPYIW